MSSPGLRPQICLNAYRSDIDGLRAIAVLSVVAFHAFPSAMKGGFAGVDIFFVISGYLISSIIIKNMNDDTFSLRTFYAGRVKRIFPALLLVLIVIHAIGWKILLADEFKQLGKHVAAGAGFIANLVLWSEIGYFDKASATKPLLHLWSLGVEAQFYIAWPVLLWIIHKKRLSIPATITAIAATSFILGLVGVEADANAAFYSPLTRFWELLCGGLLAWYGLRRKDAIGKTMAGGGCQARRQAFLNTLSFLGLALTLFGLWKVDSALGFPETWVAIPVIGAVLIIAGGENAWINRTVLSNRLAVWFGLISYPLYLWHWPLLSFARIAEGVPPTRDTRVAVVALSIGLAWITYKFIETPIRRGGNSAAKTAGLAVLMLAVGGIGLYSFLQDGLTWRHAAQFRNGYGGDIGNKQFLKHIDAISTPCGTELSGKSKSTIKCRQSKQSAVIDTLLLGDSHALHLFPGLAAALPDKNVAYIMNSGSPFIDDPDYGNLARAVATVETVKHVIISAFWNERSLSVPTGSSLELELAKAIHTLRKAGKTVSIADDVPWFPFGPEKCIRQPLFPGDTPLCDMNRDALTAQAGRYRQAILNAASTHNSVRLLDIGGYFCTETKCSMLGSRDILYRDNNHLNLPGSMMAGKKMIEDNPDIFN